MAAVVLFHYPTHQWVKGGLFGVDVFFVLSGLLVTAGLLDEALDTGTIRVRAFLARRARRLVPGDQEGVKAMGRLETARR